MHKNSHIPGKGSCTPRKAPGVFLEKLAVHRGNFIIFDAKYYCIQLDQGKTLRGQPGVGDVTKQYLYQLAYRQFTEDHGITQIRNCFLMPTEDSNIVKKGIAKMEILESLGLQNIQIRLLPAEEMFSLYLTHKLMDISRLEL